MMTCINNVRNRLQNKKLVWQIGMICLVFGSFNTYATERQEQDQTKAATVDSIVSELDREFARGSISSVQIAELALSKLDLVQFKVQDMLHTKEVACNEVFFTNSCLHDVRLKRRQLQQILRQISTEAKSFIRRARIAKSESDQ